MAADINLIKKAIEERSKAIFNQQSSDGAWRYCFEGPAMTDAYMIILLKSLDLPYETLIEKLSERLVKKQHAYGFWKTYPNEDEGNLSATIEAYTALIYSGYKKADDPMMRKAAAYIRARGGLKHAGLLTKIFLTMNGQYKWPRLPFEPSAFVLLPSFSPINFYDFSSYARAHLAPVLLAYKHRFYLKSEHTPKLYDLTVRDSILDDGWPELQVLFTDVRSIFSSLKDELFKLKQLPPYLFSKSERFLEQYVLNHLEADGTLLSYASTTFFMIYGLLAIGYRKESAIIQQAVQGLISLIYFNDEMIHVQNSPSTIWDTALISYALIEAGNSVENKQIKKAAQFIKEHQQSSYGDWSIHAPNIKPGGWGFSESDTIHPDIDDTQAALRSIQCYAMEHPLYNASFHRGINWLMAMQNIDGGWAAFEKGTDNYFLTMIPVKHMKSAAIDPSTSDLTGRALELLGYSLHLNANHKKVKSAIKWLKRHQETNGSWYGRWGICYIYGTWAAVTGLSSVGITKQELIIQKAVRWLEKIQHEDGGWGESCESDRVKKFVDLPFSTVTQTAWATDSLISVSPKPTRSIEKGINYLLNVENLPEMSLNYPVGGGLPGSFYILYHSYKEIWPLVTLSHYYRKYR
ncbi:prenyltransferase/squalene oxidase repeat-containing protein [Scopulibacillus cellulosilyticus]|uniref:Prenyltransferase/squalene oxidase repeat-containing protein n=1 Tax=Scopulibacillus cellulosilyticus TaxID=2665665 RepID=A0ABW2PUA1_9BACL